VEMKKRKYAKPVIQLLTIIALPVLANGSEIAPIGKPLKDSYNLSDGDQLINTGETEEAQSVICDMGRAIDVFRDDEVAQYRNQPIPGLQLELRARAGLSTFKGGFKNPIPTVDAMGYIVIVKNGQDLKIFSPKGGYENGEWEGDVLNSWSAKGTDIKFYDSYGGENGYAEIDLIDGRGLLYPYNGSEIAEYFLYDCRRIMETGLFVYVYEFEHNVD